MRRREELQRRRAALLARSHAQRAELAEYGARIAARLSLVDKGLRLAKSATERPLLVGAAGLLFMLFKPTRALKWVARGALVSSLVRRLLAFVELGRSR